MRVGCGLEDGALVVLEDFEPRGDIGGVVVAYFRRKFQIAAEKRGTQFGHEFLAGIAFVAPGLAPEVTFQTGGVPRPVRALVRECRVVAFGVVKLSIGGMAM